MYLQEYTHTICHHLRQAWSRVTGHPLGLSGGWCDWESRHAKCLPCSEQIWLAMRNPKSVVPACCSREFPLPDFISFLSRPCFLVSLHKSIQIIITGAFQKDGPEKSSNQDPPGWNPTFGSRWFWRMKSYIIWVTWQYDDCGAIMRHLSFRMF